MNATTDAILAYGYVWGAYCCEWLETDEDTENFTSADILWKEWWKKAEGQGLHLELHCCDGEPMIYLATRLTKAHRGYPVLDITSQITPIHTVEIARLEDFCKQKMGLKPPHDPTWFLCSTWF